jgi:hypothetical protein
MPAAPSHVHARAGRAGVSPYPLKLMRKLSCLKVMSANVLILRN